MQVRQKPENDKSHSVFPMLGAAEGLKSRLTRAAGAELSGEVRYEKLQAFVMRSTWKKNTSHGAPPEVEMLKKGTLLHI